MVGIYKIASPSGKVYIGQSWDIKKRWREHKSSKKKSKLHSSFIKYGHDTHSFEIIHELPKDIEQDVLNRYEQIYIDAYSDCGIELLNLREAGSRGKHFEEVRKIIGEKSRGHKMPDHVKQLLSKINTGHKRNLGRVRSAEHKNKTSESLKGKLHSEEHKRNNSESKSGEKHYCFGIDPANHPKAKRIKNIITGEVFGTVTEAANKSGLKRPTLSAMLTGQMNNRTNLIYDL